MKTIGVTGGTGFIGQYLIKEFGEKYRFIVMTSKTDFSKLDSNAEYVNCPYTKEGFLKAFENCEAAIHLGGVVMQGLDTEIDVEPYLPNIQIANDLFFACEKLGINNIVNASSVAVYEQINEIPVQEDSLIYPNSAYGIMKVAIEKLAALYNKKYDLKIKSLRYGQGIGFSPYKKKERFFGGLLLQNCLEKKPIPIWGEGITGRDVIYVKDMGYAAICAINHPEESGEFNIGTQFIASNIEIAKTYCEVFKNKGGVKFMEGTKESGIRTCMNCSKAKEKLDFIPRYDNLRKMIEDIKMEQERYEKSYQKINKPSYI